jgi:hypothetical protein
MTGDIAGLATLGRVHRGENANFHLAYELPVGNLAQLVQQSLPLDWFQTTDGRQC